MAKQKNKQLEKILEENSAVEAEGRVVNEDVFNKMREELIKWGGPEYQHYDPVIELAKMANDPTVDDRIKFGCNREVASYMYPKVKSYEVKGKIDSTVNVNIRIKSFGKKNKDTHVLKETEYKKESLQ